MPTATAWGYLSGIRSSLSYVAWQKIWRLAGVDHMHVNGLATSSARRMTAFIASRAVLPRAEWSRTSRAIRDAAVFSRSGQTLGAGPGPPGARRRWTLSSDLAELVAEGPLTCMWSTPASRQIFCHAT